MLKAYPCGLFSSCTESMPSTYFLKMAPIMSERSPTQPQCHSPLFPRVNNILPMQYSTSERTQFEGLENIVEYRNYEIIINMGIAHRLL